MKTYHSIASVHPLVLPIHPHIGDYVHVPWITGCARRCVRADHSGYVLAVPTDQRFTMRVRIIKPGPGGHINFREDDWIAVELGTAVTAKDSTP